MLLISIISVFKGLALLFQKNKEKKVLTKLYNIW